MGIYPRPDEGPPPKLKAPTGTTDTHMHVFDARFPLAPGQPVQPSATVDEYEVVRRRLGIDRVVVVQPNGYQGDNECLVDAVQRFGKDARGVVTVLPDVSTGELERLSAAGVCGARIMDLGGAPVGTGDLLAVADRVGAFGWHTIVQFDGRLMADLEPMLSRIPGDYIIDHAGKFLEPVPAESDAFKALFRLIDRGNCYVKLSACYETSRTGPPDYDDVGVLSKALASHAPDRMLWATNWPHVGGTADTHPDDARMLDLLLDWVPAEADRQRILVDNPARIYGF